MNVDQHSFFDPFDEKVRTALLAETEHLILSEGHVLFEEGDESDALYLVLDGEIEVNRITPEGRTVQLARIGPGDCLGEMGVFDGEKRSASARTVVQSRLARLPAETLIATIGSQPGKTVLQFLLTLSSRLRQTNEEYLQVVFNTERRHLLQQCCDSLMRWSEIPDAKPEAMAHSWSAAMGTVSDLTRAPVQVADLLEAALQRHRERLAVNGTALIVTPCEGTLDIDREAIDTVLDNLLLNAGEDWQHQQRATRITISALWRPSEVEITISDNGPGIDPAMREHACAAFVTSRPIRAVGLGLTACQHLVEAHGGTLRLHSPDGGGTTVRLTLPTVVSS